VVANPPNEQLEVRRKSLADTIRETIVALEMNIDRENRLIVKLSVERREAGLHAELVNTASPTLAMVARIADGRTRSAHARVTACVTSYFRD